MYKLRPSFRGGGISFDDDVLERLIRFVSSREVGHNLALPDNMGSSVAYPEDSLRSKSFTQNMALLLPLWIMSCKL